MYDAPIPQRRKLSGRGGKLEVESGVGVHHRDWVVGGLAASEFRISGLTRVRS